LLSALDQKSVLRNGAGYEKYLRKNDIFTGDLCPD
jgi:hypothetical protein